jgi:hypothetical protein
MLLRTSMFCAAPLVAAFLACGGDSGKPPPADAPADTAVAIDASADAPADGSAACGPTDLCARTINECNVSISMQQCLAFYDPATTTCANISGYTTCNCACLTQPTCDLYFSCGQTCFEDWC